MKNRRYRTHEKIESQVQVPKSIRGVSTYLPKHLKLKVGKLNLSHFPITPAGYTCRSLWQWSMGTPEKMQENKCPYIIKTSKSHNRWDTKSVGKVRRTPSERSRKKGKAFWKMAKQFFTPKKSDDEKLNFTDKYKSKLEGVEKSIIGKTLLVPQVRRKHDYETTSPLGKPLVTQKEIEKAAGSNKIASKLHDECLKKIGFDGKTERTKVTKNGSVQVQDSVVNFKNRSQTVPDKPIVTRTKASMHQMKRVKSTEKYKRTKTPHWSIDCGKTVVELENIGLKSAMTVTHEDLDKQRVATTPNKFSNRKKTALSQVSKRLGFIENIGIKKDRNTESGVKSSTAPEMLNFLPNIDRRFYSVDSNRKKRSTDSLSCRSKSANVLAQAKNSTVAEVRRKPRQANNSVKLQSLASAELWNSVRKLEQNNKRTSLRSFVHPGKTLVEVEIPRKQKRSHKDIIKAFSTDKSEVVKPKTPKKFESVNRKQDVDSNFVAKLIKDPHGFEQINASVNITPFPGKPKLGLKEKQFPIRLESIMEEKVNPVKPKTVEDSTQRELGSQTKDRSIYGSRRGKSKSVPAITKEHLLQESEVKYQNAIIQEIETRRITEKMANSFLKNLREQINRTSKLKPVPAKTTFKFPADENSNAHANPILIEQDSVDRLKDITRNSQKRNKSKPSSPKPWISTGSFIPKTSSLASDKLINVAAVKKPIKVSKSESIRQPKKPAFPVYKPPFESRLNPNLVLTSNAKLVLKPKPKSIRHSVPLHQTYPKFTQSSSEMFSKKKDLSIVGTSIKVQKPAELKQVPNVSNPREIRPVNEEFKKVEHQCRCYGDWTKERNRAASVPSLRLGNNPLILRKIRSNSDHSLPLTGKVETLQLKESSVRQFSTILASSSVDVFKSAADVWSTGTSMIGFDSNIKLCNDAVSRLGRLAAGHEPTQISEIMSTTKDNQQQCTKLLECSRKTCPCFQNEAHEDSTSHTIREDKDAHEDWNANQAFKCSSKSNLVKSKSNTTIEKDHSSDVSSAHLPAREHNHHGHVTTPLRKEQKQETKIDDKRSLILIGTCDADGSPIVGPKELIHGMVYKGVQKGIPQYDSTEVRNFFDYDTPTIPYHTVHKVKRRRKHSNKYPLSRTIGECYPICSYHDRTACKGNVVTCPKRMGWKWKMKRFHMHLKVPSYYKSPGTIAPSVARHIRFIRYHQGLKNPERLIGKKCYENLRLYTPEAFCPEWDPCSTKLYIR